MYEIKTSPNDKNNRFINMRDIFASSDRHCAVTDLQAIDEFNIKYKYYKEEDDSLRARMIDTFVQMNMLIFESINLETVISLVGTHSFQLQSFLV